MYLTIGFARYIATIANVANSGEYDWIPSAAQVDSADHLPGSTHFIRVRWEGTFEVFDA